MAESQLTMLMVAINNLAGVKLVNERDMAFVHFNVSKYSEENTELKDRLNEIAATGSYEDVASILLKDGIKNKSQDWSILGMFNSFEVHIFIYNDDSYCLLHDFECEKNYLQQQEWSGTGNFLKDYLCTKLKPRGFVPEDWKLTNEAIVEIISFLRDLHNADGLLKTKIIGLLDDMCYEEKPTKLPDTMHWDAKIDHIISLIKELGY